MSKKAKEVVEAAPKFAQPWQGFLSFGAIFILGYITLQWFIHPVWGYLTRMTQMNAAVTFWAAAPYGTNAQSAALLFSINNPNAILVYPLGYIVNWVSYFIFCIVWFVSIAVLARSFAPSASRLRKQPWQGIIVLALSMIFALITWYILAVVMKWLAWDMIILGTTGFVIFPIWATLFHYWPFVPKRAAMNPLARGAILVTISWILTFLLRGIISMMIWRNPIATVNTMYMAGNPLVQLAPTEPYDLWNSALFSIILGSTIMGNINAFGKLGQPKQGLVNFILAIIVGLIIWGIVVVILGNATGSVIFELDVTKTIAMPVPFPPIVEPLKIPILLSFPYVSHSNVTAFLTFPLITILAGQLTFTMWPWAKYGARGGLLMVIAGFIVGTIVYYIVMVSPLNVAGAITGSNLIPGMGGTRDLSVSLLVLGYQLQEAVPALAAGLYGYISFIVNPALWPTLQGMIGGVLEVMTINGAIAAWTSTVFALYFEGVAATTGKAIMFAWTVTVMIFYLLSYEAFDHWPWK